MTALRDAALARLAVLHDRIAAAVAVAGVAGPHQPDPLRGVYITDEHAAGLAAGDGPEFPRATDPLPPALAEWAAAIGVSELEADLLLVAAAPAIDRRYEQLYGYLNDDVTLRWATVGLALRLAGCDPTDPRARRLLTADARLAALGLVDIDDPDRPFLTRAVRVPDRVVAAVLGDDAPPPEVDVRGYLTLDNPWIADLARGLVNDGGLFHLVDSPDRSAVEAAASATVAATGTVVIARLVEPEARDVLAIGIREAVLRGCGLVVDAIEAVAAADRRVVDRLAALPRPVVLVGRRAWDPEWGSSAVLSLPAPPLDRAERAELWERVLDGALDGAAESTAAFRLGPDRIWRAALTGARAARLRGDELGPEDLRWGARQQNATGLGRLARRIEPEAMWADLVLEPGALAGVREVALRVRNRDFVLDDWGLRRGGGRGEGITALFAGPSGTGKTLAAEVIAHELGVDLHTVDLATVVDKYIGETEKNLDRIFDEAQQVNTVLFFDEADALFGKRSEVKDARDRYANVEVAYLLQRMERFDGLVVLATNLRLNIDDAFARRLDVTVDFERPEPDERLRLWEHMLGPQIPRDATVDLGFLARAFDLTGGDIRNAVVTAAYAAADARRPVRMADLVSAVAREYRKLGRLCLESEFGAWYPTAVLSAAG